MMAKNSKCVRQNLKVARLVLKRIRQIVMDAVLGLALWPQRPSTGVDSLPTAVVSTGPQVLKMHNYVGHNYFTMPQTVADGTKKYLLKGHDTI